MKKTVSILINLFLVFQLVGGMFLFAPPAQAQAINQNWDFTSAGDYTFDDTKIQISAGQAQLKASSASANWYDINWRYRKQFTINGSADGVLTNYQMKLNIVKGSGTDSGNTVYLNNLALNWPGDVRFTKSDGTTLLDFWIEESDATDGTWWTELDSIPATPDHVHFYIYYGNAAATAASNGANTFIFFDDFSGNLSKWSTTTGTWGIVGGQLAETEDIQDAAIFSTTTLAIPTTGYRIHANFSDPPTACGLGITPDNTALWGGSSWYNLSNWWSPSAEVDPVTGWVYCANNYDDDHDGLTDCQDVGDCNGQPGPGGCQCKADGSCGAASCPFVYSFDGKEYQFEHESYPFATKFMETTSYDRLKYLKPTGDSYILQITEERDEISSVEGFKFYTIDHSGNDSFVMPDINGNFHTIKEEVLPISCSGKNNDDCLQLVSKPDDNPWVSSPAQNKSDLRDYIELKFRKPNGKEAKLFLNVKKQELYNKWGLYFLDKLGRNYVQKFMKIVSSLPFASKLIEKPFMKQMALAVELWNGEKWVNQGFVKAGLELWDDSLVSLDVQNIKSDDLKIRLISTAGLFQIDYAAIDYSTDETMEVHELKPAASLLNNKETVNLDMNDGKYVTLQRGDEIGLKYNAIPEKEGWQRDYAVAIKGYYDIITSKDQTFLGFLSGFRDIISMALSKDGFAKAVTSIANENKK